MLKIVPNYEGSQRAQTLVNGNSSLFDDMKICNRNNYMSV